MVQDRAETCSAAVAANAGKRHVPAALVSWGPVGLYLQPYIPYKYVLYVLLGVLI